MCKCVCVCVCVCLCPIQSAAPRQLSAILTSPLLRGLTILCRALRQQGVDKKAAKEAIANIQQRAVFGYLVPEGRTSSK